MGVGVIRTAAELAHAPEGIRLELAPLLSVYGRNRRLSLRVERVPDRARLSHGHNNGDRSWSLMREDLDDLRYLPPEGMKVAHTLAIRIINLDTDDGATLAVLDFPVAPVVQSVAKRAEAPDIGDDLELRRLREECRSAKTALDLREQELAEVRQALERLRAETFNRDDALASARAAWQSEVDDRLAQAYSEATSKLEASRAAWLLELDMRVEESRARWQREAEVALTRAKEAWKAEEAARLAQAESQWREQSAYALAEVTARAKRSESALARVEAEATRMSGDGVALRRLREELAEANASLDARVRELAGARQALEQARADGLKSKAELVAARAAWQAEMECRLAEVRAEIAASGNAPETEALAHDLVAQAREQWRSEAEMALSRAKEDWKSDEALRFARAEAQWRKQSAQAIADSAPRAERADAALARVQAHALDESSDAAELRRVREELTETRAVLLDRETRLSQARQEMKRARERWKAETDVALKKAQEAWKAEEAYRISVARGDWQRDLRVARDEVAKENDQQPRSERRLFVDGLLAAALAVAVVILYPSVAPTLAAYWPGMFGQTTVNAIVAAPFHAPQSARPIPPPAPPVHVDVTVRGANVRAAPSATADIVTTLPRGTNVTRLEQRGNWVRVQVANGGKAQQGWVYGQYLKDAAGS